MFTGLDGNTNFVCEMIGPCRSFVSVEIATANLDLFLNGYKN